MHPKIEEKNSGRATPVTPIDLHGIINHIAKHMNVIIILRKPKTTLLLDAIKLKPNNSEDIG